MHYAFNSLFLILSYFFVPSSNIDVEFFLNASHSVTVVYLLRLHLCAPAFPTALTNTQEMPELILLAFL